MSKRPSMNQKPVHPKVARRMVRSFFVLGTIAIAMCSTELMAVVILPNLPPGSQYQLIFVTAGTRDATSSDIADYNAFVNAEAALNPLLPSTTWRAIASTPSIPAAVNAPSNDIVFNMHGSIVAGPLYVYGSGTLNDFIHFDQYGNYLPTDVWTGSVRYQGEAFPQHELGTPEPVFGQSGALDFYVMSQGFDDPRSLHSLYALSDRITVPVPEPASFVLAVLGAFGLWIVCLHSKTRSPRLAHGSVCAGNHARRYLKGIIEFLILQHEGRGCHPRRPVQLLGLLLLVIVVGEVQSASGATVTYTDGRPYDSLSFSPLTVPQWDQASYSGLSLSSVRIDFSFEGTSSGVVANETGSPTTVVFSSSGQANLTLPNSQHLIAIAPMQFTSQEVGPFIDVLLSISLQGSASIAYSAPGELAPFIGNGVVEMPAFISVNPSALPPQFVPLLNPGGASVLVTYEWAAVPEPSSVVILAAGLVALVGASWWRERMKR